MIPTGVVSESIDVTGLLPVLVAAALMTERSEIVAMPGTLGVERDQRQRTVLGGYVPAG